MKRLIIIALAIVCGVAFSDSFAKKPKKAEQTEAQKEGIRLQQEKELQELQQEMYLDSIRVAKRKEELKRLKEELEKEKELENLRDLEKRPKPYGPLLAYEEIETPCQEEAKSTDEYYAAWAVSDEQPSQSFAIQDAMRKVKIELAQQNGGENIVLEGIEQVCRRITRDRFGNYIAYVAVRMPKNK